MVATSRAWYNGSYTMAAKLANQIPGIALYNNQFLIISVIPDDAIDRRKPGLLITFYRNSSLRPQLNI